MLSSKILKFSRTSTQVLAPTHAVGCTTTGQIDERNMKGHIDLLICTIDDIRSYYICCFDHAVHL